MEGWERALAHVHGVWMPAVMEAYQDATTSSPDVWYALLGDGDGAASAAGVAAAPGSGSCAAQLVRPPGVPRPQLLLPCCIPPEKIVKLGEVVEELAGERAVQMRAEYQARVKQEQEEQQERSPGPVPPRPDVEAQSRLRLAPAAAAAALTTGLAATAGASAPPVAPVLASGPPGQAGCAAAAASSEASDAVFVPQLYPQQPAAGLYGVAAMHVDNPHEPGLLQLMQGMQLAPPAAVAAAAVGAGVGVGAGAGQAPVPGPVPLLGLMERVRVALVKDMEWCQQQVGVGGAAAGDAALVEALASLERMLGEREARLHVC